MTEKQNAETLELTPEQIFIINDMTHAWIEERKLAEFRTSFRQDCKRLLATAAPPPAGADAVREATIEECAKIADRAALRCVREQIVGDSAARFIAQNIRALLPAPQPQEKPE